MAHGGEGLSPAGWDMTLGPAGPELVKEQAPRPGLHLRRHLDMLRTAGQLHSAPMGLKVHAAV